MGKRGVSLNIMFVEEENPEPVIWREFGDRVILAGKVGKRRVVGLAFSILMLDVLIEKLERIRKELKEEK